MRKDTVRTVDQALDGALEGGREHAAQALQRVVTAIYRTVEQNTCVLARERSDDRCADLVAKYNDYTPYELCPSEQVANGADGGAHDKLILCCAWAHPVQQWKALESTLYL